MAELRSIFSTINTALHEAEVKPGHSREMLEWLQKLHDAADEAAILLDSLSSRASNGLPFVNKPARDIKKVKEQLEKIAKEKVFILKAEGKEPAVAVEKATEPSLPYSEIYEREQARDEVVKFLLDPICQEEISVLPIVGIPGIGKTTLAKLAFNDKRVREHFSNGLMKWFWMTDDADVKKIAQYIIQPFVYWIPCEKLGLDQLKALLGNVLHGREFLLVLDGVWNESGVWDELKYILGGNHGVKVIVTTCNNWVANTMKTTTPYDLEGLTESACWSIFAQTVFLAGQNMNRFYDETGRKIANKSRGVSRAAEALGRLMRKMADETSWPKVAACELWSFPEEQNEIFPALRLSYRDLPPYSYRLLAYCSIFPRDYEMDKELMIKQWIAHDFVPSEDVGHEAFNLFRDRFFFQPLQKDEDGRVLTFKLQSLIYDLARFEMKNSINRHFCCDASTSSNITEDVPNPRYLRSFILANTPGRYVAGVTQSMLKSFRLLRVLDLSYTDITSFPNSVSTLHQLRYLDLSGTKIETLPKVICRLKNLQSLILRRCSKLSKLPAKMRKMVGLIHLDIDECEVLAEMPSLLRQLRCLQTLPIFIVGEKGSSIGELGALNLRDRLSIRCLENVSVLDAEGANLKGKEHLRTLSLSWEKGSNKNLVSAALVLEALEPPKYLKRLSLMGYMGKGFPGWLNSFHLLDLVGVTLNNCKRCVHLPPLGELPFLKSLAIEGLDSVQFLGKSLYGSRTKVVFPSLKKFSCSDMICLKSWESESRGLFPHLEILIIKRCPRLSNLPRILSRPSTVEHLEVECCPNIKSVAELESLCALKMLKMIHCEGLVSLPEGLNNLTSLEYLEVDNCHSLTSLPRKGIEGLQSLRNLLIQNCRKLATLSEGLQHLTSLRKMTISGCPTLLSSSEGRQYIISLQFLTIHGCIQLATLPKGPLKDLQIIDCPGLIASPEWAKNLRLLESLVIENCQNLQNLPPEMKTMTALKKLQIRKCHSLIELPLWITDLTALKNLNISNCDSLKLIPAALSQQRTISLVIEGCCQLKEWYAERSRSRKRALESKGKLISR